MKQLLLTLTLLSSLTSLSQDGYYLIPRGMQLSFGPFSAVPTKTILFPQYAKASDISRQPMLAEWYCLKPGGFVDLSYNFSERRPFQVGASFRWQRLFKETDKHTHLITAIEEFDWKYKRSVRYFNTNIYADYSVFLFRNIYFFGRGEAGLGIYRMKNKFTWENDFENVTEQGPRNRATDFVFSGELAGGLRWQFNHSSSISLSVGYQLQSVNDFIRREYMTSLNGHLNGGSYYPNDSDFYETSDYDESRPPRVKNEFLYLKLGITHQITDRGLRNFFAEKPVLYLYPEDTLDVNVQLNLDDGHEIAYDYPKYDHQSGWNVRVAPNGTIESGDRNYYCLFWETKGPAIAQNLDRGFVIQKKEAKHFLEEKLEQLGLTDKEANEFIIYWLPKLEQSPYSAVYFANEEYEKVSELQISPAPDQVIRVMMLVEPLNQPIPLEEQALPKKPERIGFTAVEWGGSQGIFFKKTYL